MPEERLELNLKINGEDFKAVIREVLGEDLDKITALLAVCHGFIREQEISCSETIHQCDWVIENAYSFIEDVCEVLGYYSHDEEE